MQIRYDQKPLCSKYDLSEDFFDNLFLRNIYKYLFKSGVRLIRQLERENYLDVNYKNILMTFLTKVLSCNTDRHIFEHSYKYTPLLRIRLGQSSQKCIDVFQNL